MTSLETDEARNNLRGVLIFTSYLTLCTSLTLLILRDLYRQSKHLALNRNPTTSKLHAFLPFAHRLQLFSALSALSLSVTWYYMSAFFSLSYRSWALEHSVPTPSSWSDALSASSAATLRLGPWLKDVQLFRDAWEVVLETPARLVWSQPIFFVTAAWSVFLGVESQRRRVPRAWAYMLLGQIVAISFAQNLFFLAVLLFPVRGDGVAEGKEGEDSESRRALNGGRRGTGAIYTTPKRTLYAVCILLTFVSVQMIPWVTGTSAFMRVLALPHVVLVLPAVLHRLVPVGSERWTVRHASIAAADGYLRGLYELAFVLALYSQAKVAMEATFFPPEVGHLHRHSNVYHGVPGPVAFLADSARLMPRKGALEMLYSALYDHPAVSSVGWDALLCTLSFVCWRATATRTEKTTAR